jgi:hypothetical protein
VDTSLARNRAARRWHRSCEALRVLWLLIVVIIVLVAFGGVGYRRRESLGGYYAGGIGLLGLILLVMLVLLALGILTP